LPCNDIGTPQARSQYRADAAQRVATGVMAQAVVDRLEVVAVDVCQPERSAVPSLALDLAADHLVERRAVGYAGQEVGQSRQDPLSIQRATPAP